jgi:hypothetical protein
MAPSENEKEKVMKVVTQCEKCGGCEVINDVDDVTVDDEWAIVENKECDGMKLEYLEEQFGRTDIEELAHKMYQTFHQDYSENGWSLYHKEGNDAVVWFWRKTAMVVEFMRKNAGIGSAYYD